MKCCKCDKEIDIKVNEVPPTWYGMFLASEVKKVICSECIKSPKGKDWGEDTK